MALGSLLRELFERELAVRMDAERSRGRAGEAGDHAVLVEPAHLAGAALHHRLTEADLPVARDDHLALVAHGEDRRTVKRVTSLWGGHRRRLSSGDRDSRACSAA